MAAADVRWLQRLDNYERALGTLARALSLAGERYTQEMTSLQQELRRRADKL